MKTVVLALSVLLAVSQSEALRCKCGGVNSCPKSVEECTGSNIFCATLNLESNPNFFKGCMSQTECDAWNNPGVATISCCTTDLCNA
ncbi:three finger toxin MALT0070C-like [Stegastes partitus]|uniref:Three finger toxin MALT0070C-like n=1 Tax=Stegastes partitus TaxID=144197 RepID=A0A3B5AY93_9TELE|nr:PREDICTED: three finger toxin MALT0070C-like [Stegastes partitus]XP_008296712.1 PREDICTED: three finger toxin MALT0070C-like [Stegastes partitus]